MCEPRSEAREPIEERKLKLERRKLDCQRIGLFTSILTPLAIILVGALIQRAVSQADREWKSGERRAEQREAVYSELGPQLNLIYCYLEEVGDYSRYTPEEIILKKRSADRLFFSYYSYWSMSTKTSYGNFMKAGFKPYQGIATDAKIRTSYYQKQIAFARRGINWKDSWDEAFTDESDPTLRESYLALVADFLDDIQKNYQLEIELVGNGSRG